MAESMETSGPGGFLPPTPQSPALSAASSRSIAGLPHPRARPLRPGSIKEDRVRNYVSDRMLHISRRYVKKFGIPEEGDEVIGYRSMAELCKDLEEMINIIWLSGTPSLQIPYLLNVASEFNTWLSSFPPSPNATFSTLRKLDHCFASLLGGQDMDTKESLPGFENGLRGGMSKTDMVRCKSLVEQTRILIVDVMSKEPDPDDADGDETEATQTEDTDMEGPPRVGIWEEDDERLHMDVARVYENTLVALGEAMGETAQLAPVQISDD
ncbi:hypothetical protein GQ53DRAFT_692545 [Thozetella sp. PMI_491]|nr:hypothetical protein GQ53DRAFT_692545 [Thozetella sp. PMI_491]